MLICDRCGVETTSEYSVYIVDVICENSHNHVLGLDESHVDFCRSCLEALKEEIQRFLSTKKPVSK